MEYVNNAAIRIASNA